MSSFLVGRNIGESGKPQFRNSGLGVTLEGLALEGLCVTFAVSLDM